MYASVRIRARVYGAPGAVAGLFIYANGRNESDIEILTRDDESVIRYSNQPVVDEGPSFRLAPFILFPSFSSLSTEPN